MKLHRLPILNRLIPSVRKRYAPLIWPQGWRVSRFHGALFLVNYFTVFDRRLGFEHDWEDAQIDYLFGIVEKESPDLFLDIGACFGLYAILVAKSDLCGDVVAFEPDSRCRERLAANLHLNGLVGRVEIRPEAISDDNGARSFFLESTHGLGQSRVVEHGHTTVPCVRLDDVLTDLGGKCIVMKIDIEGHELAAVAGMKRLLTANRCFLQIECFAKNLPTLRRDLAALGYLPIHEIGPERYFAKRDYAILTSQ